MGVNYSDVPLMRMVLLNKKHRVEKWTLWKSGVIPNLMMAKAKLRIVCGFNIHLQFKRTSARESMRELL